MPRFRCWAPIACAALLMAGSAVLTAPLPAAATGGNGGVHGALTAADTTPGPVPARGASTVPLQSGLSPGARSVTEAAWGAEGEPAILNVVAAGLEPELLPGLRVRVELLAKWGHDGVPFPSSQGLSSLDADDFGGPGETWVEWRAADGIRLKAGRVDGNTEFASVEAASSFANPSFGLSPALGLLPSYPNPAPSVNLFVRPSADGPVVGGGVYRRGDGGWSAVGQMAGPLGRLPARWTAGVAGSVPTGDVSGAPPTAGYLIVETSPDRRIGLFGKVAAAGDLLHLAAGLTAPLPVAGVRVGLAGSRVSDPGHPSGEELVTEAFIAARPVPWLVIQPDVQLRFAPGTAPRAGALLRVIVER